MSVIESLDAYEILDSRGRPTVKCRVRLASGATAAASVPSGASTGSAEVLELRDGDPKRYRGLGCRKAAASITGPIASALIRLKPADQDTLDRLLKNLADPLDRSRFGANAILAVSLAFCRAVAVEKGIPLYTHIADLLRLHLPPNSPPPAPALPRPTINLFSGGKHAGGQIAIQDILIVPRNATIDECMATAWAVFQSAADLCGERFQMRMLRADEGGLGPPFTSIEQALETAVESIERAGFQPGRDVALAIDVASTHFFHPTLDGIGRYYVDGPAGAPLDPAVMVGRIASWVERFPIISIEDGLAEEDWTHWPLLMKAIGGRALVLGDDLLCTNPARVEKARQLGAADALLLKVNQVGTLSEAMAALATARRHPTPQSSQEQSAVAATRPWRITVSARSGETEDDWLADLAVGLSAEQIKVGSVTQSERLAKYNRLLEIERETHWPVRD